MKILYFVNGLNYKGGIARIIVDKANYLTDEMGHDVTICTLSGNKSAYPISNRIKLVTLGINRRRIFLSKLISIFTLTTEISKVIKIVSPDIVVNAQTEIVTWILPFIARSKSKIMEIHFSKDGMKHNVHNKSSFFKFIYWNSLKFFYSRYSRFVVLTPEDKPQWNLNNCVVINNFTQIHIDKISDVDNTNIICVGRYSTQKRLDLLIETWNKIANKYPEWNIYVYGGDGPEKKNLSKLVDTNGLNKSFHIMSACDDIASKYLESSIFISTSEHEGFALVLLEAMQAGLPICAFDIVGVKGIINHKKNGLLAPFGDTDKLANELIKLIESKQLRLQLRKESLLKLKDYTIERTMKKWEALFFECINENN